MKNPFLLFLLLAGVSFAGTWVGVTPSFNIPQGVLPTGFANATYRNSLAFNNSTYRTKTGEVIFMDGIISTPSPGYCHHPNSYYSTAVFSWHPENNSLGVLKICNWGGGHQGSGCLFADFQNDPTPTGRHTYNSFTYVEKEDAVYMMLGATWKYMHGSPTPEAQAAYDVDMKSTWKFDLSTKTWERFPGSIHAAWPGKTISPYESHMTYWPGGDRLLFVNDNGNIHGEYPLSTKTWKAVVPAANAPFSFYGAMSTWDSKRERWIFRKGSDVCYYDPALKKYTALPSCGIGGKDITYVGTMDGYFVTGSGNKIFYPDQNKWVDLGGSGMNEQFSFIEYDQKSHTIAHIGAMGNNFNTPNHLYTFDLPPINGVTAEKEMPGASRLSGITIAPNPFRTQATITARGKGVVRIINSLGRVLKSTRTKRGGARIVWDASLVPPGVYLVGGVINGRTYKQKITLSR